MDYGLSRTALDQKLTDLNRKKNCFCVSPHVCSPVKLKIEGMKRSCSSRCATADGLFNTGVCDREEDGEVGENSVELMLGNVLTRKQHLFMLRGRVCVI